MKNLLLFIIICLGVWQFFLKNNSVIEISKGDDSTVLLKSGAMKTPEKSMEVVKPISVYKCDGRQHCSQMNSYEEAQYFIRYCPNTKMDGDNDGIPCERQFKK